MAPTLPNGTFLVTTHDIASAIRNPAESLRCRPPPFPSRGRSRFVSIHPRTLIGTCICTLDPPAICLRINNYNQPSLPSRFYRLSIMRSKAAFRLDLGLDIDSKSLLFFGVQSHVEVLSAILVVYRFRRIVLPGKESNINVSADVLRLEKHATLAIGFLSIILAGTTWAASSVGLSMHQTPATAFAGPYSLLVGSFNDCDMDTEGILVQMSQLVGHEGRSRLLAGLYCAHRCSFRRFYYISILERRLVN